jgi:GNAT superfamily N-acetyltransferase
MLMNVTGFKRRAFERADAAGVVEIVNAVAARTVGTKQAVVDGVGNVRLVRYLPPSCEKVVVMNGRDQIVGFAYCHNVEQMIVFQVGGAVEPDYWGCGIGSLLAAWAEEQAAALAKHAPLGVRVVLQTNLYPVETEAIQLFQARGFKKVREWAHLVIELDAQPAVPDLPENLSILEMDLEQDWDIVGPLMGAAFANHWGTISETFENLEEAPDLEMADEEPEDESYSNAPGYCFVALHKQRVVGGVLCNRKWVERSDTGRVGSLFVHPEFQRRGIGRALMLAAFQAFWQIGLKRIITDTDAESFSETPRFYANLGMRPYRQEFLYEKVIRPGREVRRLER